MAQAEATSGLGATAELGTEVCATCRQHRPSRQVDAVCDSRASGRRWNRSQSGRRNASRAPSRSGTGDGSADRPRRRARSLIGTGLSAGGASARRGRAPDPGRSRMRPIAVRTGRPQGLAQDRRRLALRAADGRWSAEHPLPPGAGGDRLARRPASLGRCWRAAVRRRRVAGPHQDRQRFAVRDGWHDLDDAAVAGFSRQASGSSASIRASRSRTEGRIASSRP